MGGVEAGELVAYLDELLDVANVPDEPQALNGLQVEGPDRVRHVVACTDACQATIEAAVAGGADLMLVHHGLFWGGLAPLTGRSYRRVRALIENGIGLYSAHVPLDVHPEVGNNVELARGIDLPIDGGFGDYRGIPIGVYGELEVSREDLAGRVTALLGVEPRVIASGPEISRRIGVVTGGGGSLIGQARDAGLDTYITGEGAHHTYFDAEEWGLNVIYAGHYATETLGVRALGRHLADRFGIAWEFVDHPTGL